MKFSFNWKRKGKDKPLGLFFEECLSKEESIKIKDLDFEKLTEASKEERLIIITEAIGSEKAEWLNSRIEEDFLLGDQKERLTNWINGKKDVLPKWQKEVRVKISGMKRYLEGKELDDFLRELVELSLGLGITLEETQILADLSKKANCAKVKMEDGGSKMDYENAKKEFDEYVEKLKNS